MGGLPAFPINVAADAARQKAEPHASAAKIAAGCALRSSLPAGFAQALDHVRVILRTMPWDAAADIHVEGRWCERDRLVERVLGFGDPTFLCLCRRQPAIDQRVFRIGADRTLCRIYRRLVVAAIVVANGHLVQPHRQQRSARIEAYAGLDRCQTLMWSSRENQSPAQFTVRRCQVGAYL